MELDLTFFYMLRVCHLVQLYQQSGCMD